VYAENVKEGAALSLRIIAEGIYRQWIKLMREKWGRGE
jgi:hypothetical protein